ncbi:heat shock chaperone [Mesorhizobium metallidurans STM 2683]|uniref:Heat shock chaperone n=1 Tax=Mesorhizobium metallidurans STM 2683 TaxID=1297569 RepID=M5ELS6_9HYPH|nr:Hsp20 family protein [Mesorhizobium metallidurans]CCV05699.1 heat shock chaperone [Mesorhizobium metallidurans STM 2683]
MRSLDYAPLYRSTVGFDRLFDLLDNSVRTDWPPYNIEKTGDNDYRITMAIAGFTPEEVEVTQHGPELIVVGQKQTEETDRQVLHRGMVTRNFRHVFRLADYVKVANASLESGLLSVDLMRDIPEELKPRRIGISTGKQPSQNKQISQDTQPQSKVA